MMHDKTGAVLKGSFTVEIGNQDEASKRLIKISIKILISSRK